MTPIFWNSSNYSAAKSFILKVWLIYIPPPGVYIYKARNVRAMEMSIQDDTIQNVGLFVSLICVFLNQNSSAT